MINQSNAAGGLHKRRFVTGPAALKWLVRCGTPQPHTTCYYMLRHSLLRDCPAW